MHYIALRCVALHHHISVGYVQKSAQKQPKTVLSAGMKTFEISKLESHK